MGRQHNCIVMGIQSKGFLMFFLSHGKQDTSHMRERQCKYIPDTCSPCQSELAFRINFCKISNEID